METSRDTARPVPQVSNIRVCAHCAGPYDWRRSPSTALKMTYCGSLCERADLGFTIDAILQASPRKVTRALRVAA